MTQIAEIRALLELDNTLASLRDSLEDAEWRSKNSPELERARAHFDAAASKVADIRKNQRRVDGEIAGLTAKITPEEKRLYDGSVRNPKELTNIQHELDLLKEHRSTLEDELLEILAALETAEAEEATAKEAFEAAAAKRSAETGDLDAEVQRLTGAIATAQASRKAQAPKVAAINMKTYTDARRRHGSGAVARVAGGNCSGCRVSIPESVRRRAFTADQIAVCPNCDRILYVG
ncbi:MAG: zinc ribbon domain-containing protein [Dehalococcoidia bacterium]